MPPGIPTKALPLLLFLSLFPASAQEVQIRSNVELVVVPVTVKDKNGKLAGGLTQADFTISEAGKKQNITSFSIDPVPLSAVILIDTGISQEALTRVKNSFPALMGAFAEEDEIEVYRFDKHVEKLMDFTSDRVQIQRTFDKLVSSATASSSSTPSGPFAEPGPVINGAPIIPGVQSAGRTIAPPTKALHDAIFQAAEDLGTRSVERRKIALIASDGRNQGSVHSYDATIERLLLYGVQVFSFGVDTSLFQRVRSTLLSYAKATGGDVCFPDSQNALESCYSLSTEQARNQYVLGYISANKRPAGKPVFREIKVQLSRAGTEIRHRKGYYQTP